MCSRIFFPLQMNACLLCALLHQPRRLIPTLFDLIVAGERSGIIYHHGHGEARDASSLLALQLHVYANPENTGFCGELCR